MNSAINNAVMRNTAFAWIALATGLLLLIPLLAMQLTDAVKWDSTDFMIMAALLFGSGSLFVLVARKVPYRYWLATGIVLAAGFFYAWAEMAVGIFTNVGR